METFNAHFSLLKFLKSVAAEFDLHTFLNQKLTASEESLLNTLDRWLILTIHDDATDILQPMFVNLALYATPDADPTTLWLKRTPHQFNTYCLQRKTLSMGSQAHALIPIYDYDTYIGTTALQTFQQTGKIPSTLLTALGLDYPTISYYEPLNQRVGLQYLTATSPEAPEVEEPPYRVRWRQTYRYFQPEHMMGSLPTL